MVHAPEAHQMMHRGAAERHHGGSYVSGDVRRRRRPIDAMRRTDENFRQDLEKSWNLWGSFKLCKKIDLGPPKCWCWMLAAWRLNIAQYVDILDAQARLTGRWMLLASVRFWRGQPELLSEKWSRGETERFWAKWGHFQLKNGQNFFAGALPPHPRPLAAAAT